MQNRRNFIRRSFALGGVFLTPMRQLFHTKKPIPSTPLAPKGPQKPIVISTWRHGLKANAAAWDILKAKGAALDAVEQGVRVIEADPENQSVGLGGRPDREGVVTLDACIMDQNYRCGAVAFLTDIVHPVTVARYVMERTPHVLLVGEGALQFALENGMKRTNLLTEKSKKQWREWLKKSEYQPVINIENHDTIGMLALDASGHLSGSCTTSGMAYKLHGRVGDSPIIGAGLFVDNEVGAACATGMGEEVIRIAGSAIVVELMRQGQSPRQACKSAVERIVARNKSLQNTQVGFIALNKAGEHGGYSIRKGFDYAVRSDRDNGMLDAGYLLS